MNNEAQKELIKSFIAKLGVNGIELIKKADSSHYVAIGTGIGLFIGFA